MKSIKKLLSLNLAAIMLLATLPTQALASKYYEFDIEPGVLFESYGITKDNYQMNEELNHTFTPNESATYSFELVAGWSSSASSGTLALYLDGKEVDSTVSRPANQSSYTLTADLEADKTYTLQHKLSTFPFVVGGKESVEYTIVTTTENHMYDPEANPYFTGEKAENISSRTTFDYISTAETDYYFLLKNTKGITPASLYVYDFIGEEYLQLEKNYYAADCGTLYKVHLEPYTICYVTVVPGSGDTEYSLSVFAKKKLLQDEDPLTVKTQPTTTNYVEGDTFDPTGMVITARYNTTRIKSEILTDYTIGYEHGDAFTAGDTKVIISSGGYTLDIPVTVTEAPTVVTNVRVWYEDDYTMVIPGADTTIQYQKEVLDQKGQDITADCTLTWAVTPAGQGVNIDQNGLVTVTPSAIAGTYAISGTVSPCTGSTNLIITEKLDADVSASLSGVTYGETVADPVYAAANKEETEGSWTLLYTGDDYSSTEKPTAVGDYTFTATYEDATYTGSASVDFTISPKVLTSDNLTFVDETITKQYDGSTTSDATVAVKSDVLVGDDTLTIAGVAVYDSADVTATKVTFTPTAITEGNYMLAATETVEKTATITAVDVAESGKNAAVSVVKDHVAFVDPTFGDVTGTLTYTDYADHAAVVTALSALAKDATLAVPYTYTASGNYNGTITGTITFTVVGIEFTGAITPATATYGDTLNTIFGFAGDEFTAKVGEEDITGTYALYVDSVAYDATTILDADTGYNYEVKFTDDADTHVYEDVTVCTGSFDVAARVATLDWTNNSPYTYDGTTTFAPTAVVRNLVDGDSVTVTVDGGSDVVITDDTVTATALSDTNYTLTGATGTTATYSVVAAPVSGTVTIASTDADSSETLNVGDTLTANIDAITPGGGTVTYQWYKTAGGETTAIGTDSASYTLSAADVAGKIYVTASFSGNTTGSVDSTTMYIAKYPLTGEATITNTDGVLTVSAPTNTDIATTDYTITWTGATTVTGDRYTLTNADKGTTITVTIAATVESEGFTGTLTNTVDIPATAPEFTTISASCGNGSATLSWAVDDCGSDITGYSLSATYVATSTTTDETTGEITTVETVTNVTGAPFTDIPANATRYTVSGLTNGTEYTFVLTATNGEGDDVSDTVTATPYKPTSSGGGGGGSAVTTQPTTTTNDDGSVTASVSTSATTSGSTSTATVTDSKLDAAIESAEKAADGEIAKVEIPVTTNASTDTVKVKLSGNAAQAVADSDVDALIVDSKLGTVEIPSSALSEIADQADGDDVTISINNVDSNDLTDDQAAILGDSTVVDLTVTAGKTAISGLDDAITVTLPYALKNGEDADNVVVWNIDKDGTITPVTATYDAKTGLATFETNAMGTFAVLHDATTFTDVNPNAYYYRAIQWAVANGITTGYEDDTFRPTTTANRAQVVTFLWRAAGCPEATIDNPFADLDADAYYYDAVLWAVEQGITQGVAESTFAPYNMCNRGQIVTFMYRMDGEKAISGAAMPDVAIGSYCYDAVLWAVDKSITTGYTDGTFQPDTLCDRGQIVTFLYRYLG